MNKVQVIIEYLLMIHNVNQVVVIITMNYSMKIIQYKKEFVTQVQTVDLLMKMVFTINTIVHLNVYSIVHNMVYTFMIRVMDINVVMVIIIHVIVLAHHLAIRRDLILISVIIKEAL